MAAAAPQNGFVDAPAARTTRAVVKPYRFSRGPLLPMEANIAITRCGVCHSDLHLTDDDWGVSTYPLVPGHEIAGTAIPAGDQATGLRIRQRVGVSAAASPGELRVPMFGLVEGQKSAGGSAVGSNAETRKRLEVAERIDSPIEIYKTPEVNEVQSRLRRNEIRYRAVLTPDRNTWSRG